MPRPFCPRRISAAPDVTFFKPAGIPLHKLEVIVLALDEFESLRMADRDGLEHAEAAQRMGVSRQTFTRIVRAARKKVADFLSLGSALSIKGGPVANARCVEGKGCPRKGASTQKNDIFRRKLRSALAPPK